MNFHGGARKRSASIRQSFKMSQEKYHEDIMKKTNQSLLHSSNKGLSQVPEVYSSRIWEVKITH